jgi:tripartite-type tricarboxylate transporter receptor subunit TctC
MASVGIGSTPHISGELFKLLTGIDMLHVPYRGSGPAVTDLLSGVVQVLFTGPPTLMDHIRTGRLRALGTASAQRLAELPDIPAINEFLPGYEANTWFGVGAPKATPTPIIEKLNQAINTAIADPVLVARFAAVGGILFGGTPAEFGKLIADETEKWGKVIRAANIRIE